MPVTTHGKKPSKIKRNVAVAAVVAVLAILALFPYVRPTLYQSRGLIKNGKVVVDVDATGQGDVPVTLNGEVVGVSSSVDLTVTLDSEIVSVDATGQGDVPISTSRDLTVTLDSEVIMADVTGQGDVPIKIGNSEDITVTLGGEVVVLGAGSAEVGSLYTSTNQIGEVLVKGYNDSTWRNVLVDKSTDSFAVVDFSHHQIHDGSSFSVHIFDTDWDKTDSMNVAFTTPDTASWVHMFPIVDATSITTFTVYENCTVTAGSGTPYLAHNRNRNAVGTITSTVSSLAAVPVAGEVSLNVTIVTTGTVMHEELFGANKKGGSAEGGRDINEYILRQDTTYCFDMRHLDLGDDNVIANMMLNWYEHQVRVASW